MSYTIKKQIRQNLPQVGSKPYRQIHAHSTGNPRSTAQNEADYMSRKDINNGFYTHVVGNGIVIQTAPVNQGAYDVGGDWNCETYAAVELIESHASKEEFMRDYTIYIELLRDLAADAGIKPELDTSGTWGIKTHEYCTYNQPKNKSDHVDPYPYLKKWNISKEQFKHDVENGLSDTVEVQKLIKECGEIMFLYNNGEAIFGVMGGNRYHIPTHKQVEDFKNICKDTTGRDCKHYKSWKKDGETVKLVEAMTNLMPSK